MNRLHNSYLLKLLSFLLFVCVLCLYNNSLIYAQKDMKAAQHASTAEYYMKKANFKEAAIYYKEALKREANNSAYKYGLAMSYYRQKNYEKALSITQELLASKKVELNYYRLSGNCYDLMDDYTTAISTLKRGIEVFPHSGELYLDLGIIEMIRGDVLTALTYWESGIQANPTYPDNYYWAAKTYSESNEKVWTLVYGELYLNLAEGTSDRFAKMSGILYETYKTIVEQKEAENVTVSIERADETNPFVEAHYRIFKLLRRNNMMNLEQGRTLYGGNTIKSIAMIRKSFLETWLQGFILAYPNILYKKQRELLDLTFYEAYNFWLFSKANTKDFTDWMQKNEPKYTAFINYFVANPLQLDLENYVSRQQYVKKNKKEPFK